MDKVQTKHEMKLTNFIGLMAIVTILVVLVGGLVIKNLGVSFLFNQKLIGKKNTAQQTLATDVNTSKAIVDQYNHLGVNKRLVVDALPTETDIPGLANAVSSMASVSSTQLTSVGSAQTSSATAGGGAAGGSSVTAIEMPVSISANVSYANLPHFLSALEGSARPIIVKGIQLAGTTSNLTVQVSATTYYQHPATFNVTMEAVK